MEAWGSYTYDSHSSKQHLKVNLSETILYMRSIAVLSLQRLARDVFDG